MRALRIVLQPAPPLLLAMVLAGCATTQPFDVQHCPRGFATANAEKLSVDSLRPLGLKIDESSPCTQDDVGNLSTYEVLRLPEFESPYYVKVVSHTVEEGDRKKLFPPIVVTLDASGQVARALEPERFVFRGGDLTGTMFFNAENRGERYLAILSNPKRVGQTVQHTEQGSQTIGLILFAWYGGRDKTYGVEFTRYGELEVSATGDPGARRE